VNNYPHDVTSPYALIAEIDRNAREIDAGGRTLAKAIVEFAKVTQVYEAAIESEKIRIFDAAKNAGERMPAEDIRNAIAHRAVDSGVYARYLAKLAEIDALKAWTKTLASAMSARQSLLAAMREEVKAG
jgi:hypothetical protein